MRISVAICTWNRAGSLSKTLETIAVALARTTDPVEVIVVNNNSTDQTDAVIAQFAGSMPLRRVFEPTPGLSNARNAAVCAASGDYLIWTDDDVRVDPDWLASYGSAFRSHPDASFFGGPIIPRFDGAPAGWLAEAWTSVADAYAARDFGEAPFPFSPDRLPYGANFAVRMEDQRPKRFDPRLGRCPGDYWLTGEESRLLLELLSEGKTGWWVPAARVEHCIPPERQTTSYIRRYYQGVGRSEMISFPPSGSLRLFGIPVRICRDWLKWEVRYLWLRATRGPADWLPKLALKSRARGWLQGALPNSLTSLLGCNRSG